MNLYEAIDMFIASIDPETCGIVDIAKFDEATEVMNRYENATEILSNYEKVCKEEEK